MKVKCHQLSSAGAVRDHNEDYVVFWEPEDFEQRRDKGSIAILADGVGGEKNGDIASRLAVETALSIFQEAKAASSVTDLVRSMLRHRSSQGLPGVAGQGPPFYDHIRPVLADVIIDAKLTTCLNSTTPMRSRSLSRKDYKLKDGIQTLTGWNAIFPLTPPP